MPTLRIVPLEGLHYRRIRTKERVEQSETLRLQVLAAELQDLLDASVISTADRRRILKLCTLLSQGAKAFVAKGQVILGPVLAADESPAHLYDVPAFRREQVLEQVSPRELEFLQLVCSEAEPTYEQIAKAMGVHRRSVDNYRVSLFEKFHLRSKTGLVIFAMRWGLLK